MLVGGTLSSSGDGSWTRGSSFRASGTGELVDMAVDASAVARAIAYAIEQPKDVDTNEIILRPTAQAL